MSQLEKFRRQREALAEKRKRQLALFKSTKRRGHAARAAQLGRQMRWFTDAIRRLEASEPKTSWKLAFAARFIAPFEGLRTAAYQDSGGIWTIGYGHTGKYAYPGSVISKAKAMALFIADLREFAAVVNRNFTRPLSVRQRIAAISFAYNVGEGGLQSSTFLREFNAGNVQAAADALLLWVKDERGNTLAGLVRRRRLERWLFLNPRKDS